MATGSRGDLHAVAMHALQMHATATSYAVLLWAAYANLLCGANAHAISQAVAVQAETNACLAVFEQFVAELDQQIAKQQLTETQVRKCKKVLPLLGDTWIAARYFACYSASFVLCTQTS